MNDIPIFQHIFDYSESPKSALISKDIDNLEIDYNNFELSHLATKIKNERILPKYKFYNLNCL